MKHHETLSGMAADQDPECRAPAATAPHALAALQAALRTAAHDLTEQSGQRARAAAAARSRWQGGRRLEFDEYVRALDREARRIEDALQHLARTTARALEDAEWAR
jgi:uncharacterized protein YukE